VKLRSALSSMRVRAALIGMTICAMALAGSATVSWN
jgi:hypothetical protein